MPAPRRETLEQNVKRFWEKVDKSDGPTGCWKWLGGIRSGVMGGWPGHDGKVFYAHKFAYFQGRGRIYNQTNRIRLKCDNRWCVNPRHMTVMGYIQGGTKLSLDNVRQIRYTHSRLKEGLRELTAETGVSLSHVSFIQPIAEKYHVSRQTIYLIITNQLYKGL